MKTINELYPEITEEIKHHDMAKIKKHMFEVYGVNSFKKMKPSQLEEFLFYLKSIPYSANG